MGGSFYTQNKKSYWTFLCQQQGGNGAELNKTTLNHLQSSQKWIDESEILAMWERQENINGKKILFHSKEWENLCAFTLKAHKTTDWT